MYLLLVIYRFCIGIDLAVSFLLFRFVEKAPSGFMLHTAFPAVMECALAGLMMQHREANSSVTKFLRTVIECKGSISVRINVVCRQT